MSVRQEDLLGSWTLVRIELLDPADTGPPPFGGKPEGVLHYLPDGRMVAILHQAGRADIPGGRKGGTDQEWKRAARSFTAYAGPYEIMSDHVVHHVEFNAFPNDVGTDYIRYARIEDGMLVLETPLDPGPDQRPMRLFWKRMG
jgi:hypothetical protein